MAARRFRFFASVALVATTLSLRPDVATAADTGAALGAIADTADRICGIVATQGEAAGSNVKGDVHAELNGLAKRLASLGVSGTADITSSSYQGVLQQDLPTTLKDVRECKLGVLEKLRTTLLPGIAQRTGPGAPSPDLIRSPSSATPIDVAKSSYQDDYGLYSCISLANAITCYVVVARTAAGESDYPAQPPGIQYKLIDNFHIDHRLRRAFFIDGLGGQQKSVNLSTGESVWYALEFEPGPSSVSSARIVFSPYQMQLIGPIVSGQ